MHRILNKVALVVVVLSSSITVIVGEEGIVGAPVLAESGRRAESTDSPGRGSPLEGRLIGVWVSIANDTATLEYTEDGRLIERAEGGVYTARYRVVSPTQYEIYDPETGQGFRFTVYFPNPDRMSLISTTGMRTEWRRARGPG
jgi:hypothetical protein